jgi:hypothetical protein
MRRSDRQNRYHVYHPRLSLIAKPRAISWTETRLRLWLTKVGRHVGEHDKSRSQPKSPDPLERIYEYWRLREQPRQGVPRYVGCGGCENIFSIRPLAV